jgi:hypothetical protein
MWTRERSHANPRTDFRIRAGLDRYSRRRRGPVLLLMGFPAATAVGVERDGAFADPILALARAGTALVISTSFGLGDRPHIDHSQYRISVSLKIHRFASVRGCA